MKTKNKSAMIYELVKAIIFGLTALVVLFYGLGSNYSVSVLEYYLYKMDFSIKFPFEPQMLWCYLRMISFYFCCIICIVSVISYKVYDAAENNKELPVQK
jgi:hypothetical protein